MKQLILVFVFLASSVAIAAIKTEPITISCGLGTPKLAGTITYADSIDGWDQSWFNDLTNYTICDGRIAGQFVFKIAGEKYNGQNEERLLFKDANHGTCANEVNFALLENPLSGSATTTSGVPIQFKLSLQLNENRSRISVSTGEIVQGQETCYFSVMH